MNPGERSRLKDRAKPRSEKLKNGRVKRVRLEVVWLNFPIVMVAGYGKMCYALFLQSRDVPSIGCRTRQ